MEPARASIVAATTAGLAPVRLPRSAAACRAWVGAGWLCLLLGIVGIVVPLLPTVDMVGLAAFCFARGSRRWEAWLLNHARLGPLVRDWRANRSVPLGAKCLATLSMAASCAWAAVVLPARTAWIPAVICLLVASYLWSRPTRRRQGVPCKR
jgi:uncharacterized membrane protein YbaN (DUF454 family)